MEAHVRSVAFLALVNICRAGESPCVQDYKLYSTKTVYETVRYKNAVEKPSCTPLTIWFLSRHGTRYTKVKDQQQILTPIKNDIIANARRGSLCASAISAIGNWSMRMEPENDVKLADTGWNELTGIGSRMKTRYPSLFQKYDEDLYVLRHSNYSGKGDRTKDTARAWSQGVFGTHEGVKLTEMGKPDWLFHFYKFCDKYKEQGGEDDSLEMDKFTAGPEMTEALRNTSRLAGLGDHYFNYDTLDEVYDMCRIERGIYGESPWCGLFTPEVLKVFEYAEDLKYFYEDSYGHAINYEQSCSLMQDSMETFRDALQNKGKKAVAGFGHSMTLNAFYALIGWFKDGVDLHADSFESSVNRKYRISLTTPMAANVRLVLSDCISGHVVEAFVNEEPMMIPGCPDLQCPFEMLESLWQPIVDTCDMEDMCEVEDYKVGSASSLTPGSYFTLAIVLMMFGQKHIFLCINRFY